MFYVNYINFKTTYKHNMDLNMLKIISGIWFFNIFPILIIILIKDETY